MPISRRLAFGAAALPLALAAATDPAHAQSPGGNTLDAVVKRGTLIVGVSLGTPRTG